MSDTDATTGTSAATSTLPDESTSPRTGRTPVLEVSGLGIDLVREPASLPLVADVSFRLDAGATLGLVGESGSGKSVTAMSLLGLLPPSLQLTSGTVRLDGEELTRLDEQRLRGIRGREVGVVFQDPQRSLNPAFTIGNQMVETLRTHTGMSNRAARERGIELLDRVGISHPAARMNDYPHQLSGGMAQRVGIALAVALDPKLLIADEPTTALDVTVQAQILTLLRELQDDTAMAMLLISHDLSVIAEVADDIAVMYGGEVVEHGDVVSTLTAPVHPYTEALLAAQPDATPAGAPMAQIPGSVPPADSMPPGCRFHPRCAHAVDACGTERPSLRPDTERPQTVARCLRLGDLDLLGAERQATRVPASSAGDEPAAPRDQSSPVLLEVDGLHKTYRLRTGRLGRKLDFDAVDDVSLELRQGETLGLVGESGAGKSTVGRVVLGLASPSAGTVRFGDVDVGAGRRSHRRSIRRDLQVVFQNPYSSLDPTMRIGDSVAEPLDVHHRLDASARDARVIELLDQVGLDPGVRRRRPHELSGGQRQRVAIARALALNPRLIVCDEPVSALDVSTQAQVVNLLRELQERFGIAYLFVGHDLSLVRQISDRIAVMHRGRVVEIGPADEVYTSPRHPYTAALLSAVLSVDPRTPRLAGRGDASAGRPTEHAGDDAACRYAGRCAHATDRCVTDVPPPVEVAPRVVVRCHHPLA